MNIVQFHAENIKRVKVVDITPAEDVIIISGKNENGKSSVIDAIWLALEYRAASKNNGEALRKGEDKGIITLDLGDYIVTRRFTENDSVLDVRTPDGSKITSPQKLLDGMIGDLSFDPYEFSRKNEQEQRTLLSDLLFKITEGKLNLADFDAKKQEAYDARTEANREKKRLASLLANLRPPVDADPREEISVTDLTNAITEAVDTKRSIDSSEDRIARNKTDILRQQEIIKAAQEKVTLLEEQNDKILQEIAALSVPDIAYLQNQLQNIEANNRRAREVNDYEKIRKSLSEVDEHIEALNAKMELLDIEKAEALEAAPLPINGFTINAEGVRIVNEDGTQVPFSQGSTARRLKISLAIAMAANPTLRVIRIADGSTLDDESLQVIRDMAKDKDFQVWVEYASRNADDKIGFYIEDGRLV